MKKLLIFFSIFVLSFINLAKAKDIKILYKLENEIITNQDIVDEANYLISMNKSLNQITKKDIYKISIQSLIKEKIKYLEVIKYYDLNSENAKLNELVLSNLISQYRVNNKQDLEKLIDNFNLNMDEINTKMKIEVFWKKRHARMRPKKIFNTQDFSEQMQLYEMLSIEIKNLKNCYGKDKYDRFSLGDNLISFAKV